MDFSQDIRHTSQNLYRNSWEDSILILSLVPFNISRMISSLILPGFPLWVYSSSDFSPDSFHYFIKHPSGAPPDFLRDLFRDSSRDFSWKSWKKTSLQGSIPEFLYGFLPGFLYFFLTIFTGFFQISFGITPEYSKGEIEILPRIAPRFFFVFQGILPVFLQRFLSDFLAGFFHYLFSRFLLEWQRFLQEFFQDFFPDLFKDSFIFYWKKGG